MDPSSFGRFAGMMAAHFRGRVSHYFTLNEPQIVLSLGYAQGLHGRYGFHQRGEAGGPPAPPGRNPRCPGFPRTALNWPITPEIMEYGYADLYQRYGLPLYVTECGLSCNDHIFLDGKVHDPVWTPPDPPGRGASRAAR